MKSWKALQDQISGTGSRLTFFAASTATSSSTRSGTPRVWDKVEIEDRLEDRESAVSLLRVVAGILSLIKVSRKTGVQYVDPTC